MLPVQAPDEPGDYVIEVDVVCERVAWLSELAVRAPRLPCRSARNRSLLRHNPQPGRPSRRRAALPAGTKVPSCASSSSRA